MKITALVVFVFAAALALSFTFPLKAASANTLIVQSTWHQSTIQLGLQYLSVESPSLPSPFVVAAVIVALVAVFGAVLSLLLRRREKNRGIKKWSGERFWAIDSYGA